MSLDLGRYTDGGGPFLLPASAIQRFAFLAKSGAGKTYCAAVLAEEMLKNGIPIIVIDPMSIWWGLRKGADGRSDGYPVVVFGGDHADLPLDVEKAEELARAIVESNISCVIDVADLSHAALQRFIPPFLEELRRVNVEDRHVFIEEADVIAPQKPGPDETRCLGAVDVFVRRGGNKNLGTTLISQRSAVVNKNVLTQSDVLVVLRTTAPQDKDAVAAWAVRRSADKKELNAWLDSLDGLKNGEAYVWGELPGDDGAQVRRVRMRFRERETFHATRENLKRFKGVKPMPVDEFVAKFSKVFERSDELQEAVEATEEPDEGPRPPIFEPAGDSGPAIVDDAIKAVVEFERPEPKTSSVGSFTLEVTRLRTDSLEAKVVYVLHALKKAAYPKEIITEALEYGWVINGKNFGRGVAPTVADGLVLKMENGMYRLPEKIQVAEVPA